MKRAIENIYIQIDEYNARSICPKNIIIIR
jgi:hypothetical protein